MTGPTPSVGPASLVAPVHDSTTWHTGMGMLDYAITSAEDIGKGDLLGASLNGGAAALGALGAISDPLGYLITAGVGWCLEHVGPLRDFLDWLAGKPDVIASFAQTWENVGQRMKQVGDELIALVQRDTAMWKSSAIDAYKVVMLDQAANIKAGGVAAEGIGTATSVAGIVVAVVRATVRDLIAEAVGAIISKALQALTVVMIPKVVVEIGMLVTKWSLRIIAKIKELISAIGRITHATSKLKLVFDALDKAALNVARAHSGRLSAWINTTITPGNKLKLAFDDLAKFNKAAGHGHVPHVPSIAAPNAVTTATNPSHIGFDFDESKHNDGRPIIELDL